MYTRIVVPLSGSAVAERALAVAEELATLAAVPLHLVRVVDRTRLERSGPCGLGLQHAGRARVLAVEEDAARSYLARIERRVVERGVRATTELRRGRVIPELVAVARPDDLVVMAAHRRSTLARWFLGDIADQLPGRSPAPVLLVSRGWPDDRSRLRPVDADPFAGSDPAPASVPVDHRRDAA